MIHASYEWVVSHVYEWVVSHMSPHTWHDSFDMLPVSFVCDMTHLIGAMTHLKCHNDTCIIWMSHVTHVTHVTSYVTWLIWYVTSLIYMWHDSPYRSHDSFKMSQWYMHHMNGSCPTCHTCHLIRDMTHSRCHKSHLYVTRLALYEPWLISKVTWFIRMTHATNLPICDVTHS